MAINLQEEYNNTNIQGIIDQLENDLVGLTPVKQRIILAQDLCLPCVRLHDLAWHGTFSVDTRYVALSDSFSSVLACSLGLEAGLTLFVISLSVE